MKYDRILWTIELIQKLQQYGVGDYNRLSYIKNALENGNAIYESDRLYLKDKFIQLQQIKKTELESEYVGMEEFLPSYKAGFSKKMDNTVSLYQNDVSRTQNFDESEADEFVKLDNITEILSKIKGMITNTKNEFLMLGSEKDFLKFYQSDIIYTLKQSHVNFKLLTSCTKRTIYIFDELDRSLVRRLPKDISNSLCFMLTGDELLFFTKNASFLKEYNAISANSEAMISSMKLLFECMWQKSTPIHL